MPDMNEKSENYSFSPETGGFYLSSLHGDNIPDDAIPISEEHYTALMDGQAEGQRIMSPDSGHTLPWLSKPAPPSAEERTARERAAIYARLKEIDADSVRPLRAIANGEATKEDRAKLAALDAEAAKLRDRLGKDES